jgi:hypothetical protein
VPMSTARKSAVRLAVNAVNVEANALVVRPLVDMVAQQRRSGRQQPL